MSTYENRIDQTKGNVKECFFHYTNYQSTIVQKVILIHRGRNLRKTQPPRLILVTLLLLVKATELRSINWKFLTNPRVNEISEVCHIRRKNRNSVLRKPSAHYFCSVFVKKNCCWRNFSCSPWFSASGVRRDSSNAGVATPWRRDHSDATVQADFVSRRRRRRHKNEVIAAKIYRSTYSSFVRNAYLEFCKVKKRRKYLWD